MTATLSATRTPDLAPMMDATVAVRQPELRVRPGGLVDVPAVVRLIVGPPTPCPEGPAPEQAARALRLTLAHYLLEEGEVWVAEDGLGHPGPRLRAAAIWLPPGARPAAARMTGVLTRELRHPLDVIDAAEQVREALTAAVPEEGHWTLTLAGPPDEEWDEALAAELLAPGLRAVDREGAGVVAVTPTARRARRLRSAGFRELRGVPTGPARALWLTTRPPLPPLP
jgi:hypothetical protein